MPQPKLLKVFLCHSSNDKPVVRELYQKLCAEAWIDPWLDEEKLFPGQDWNLEIEKAVEAADAILVCLSNKSITKEGYVQRELRIVLDYADYKPEGTLYLIPVRLEACEPPRRLRPWQYADYFPPERRDWSFGRLMISLKMRAEALGISISQIVSPISLPPDVSEAEHPAKPPVIKPDHLTIGDMEFCQVPAGKFLMGSEDDDSDAIDSEKPQHSLEIPYDYWLARFPVTNEQYNLFLKVFKGKHPVSGWEYRKDHPVVSVSWEDAKNYLMWLNENQTVGLPKGSIYRLPTEAEWEKAARGAYGNIYPWGNEFDLERCNSAESGKRDTLPVGAFPNGASPYGCEQMAGNVWEWTHTLLEKYPYKVDDGREDEQKIGSRVLRGGGFAINRLNVRCAPRERYFMSRHSANLGFRVCVAPILK